MIQDNRGTTDLDLAVFGITHLTLIIFAQQLANCMRVITQENSVRCARWCTASGFQVANQLRARHPGHLDDLLSRSG